MQSATTAAQNTGTVFFAQNDVGGGLPMGPGFEFDQNGPLDKAVGMSLAFAYANPESTNIYRVDLAAVESLFGTAAVEFAKTVDGTRWGAALMSPLLMGLCCADRYTDDFPHFGKPSTPDLTLSPRDYYASVKRALDGYDGYYAKLLAKDKDRNKLLALCKEHGVAVPAEEGGACDRAALANMMKCAQTLEAHITNLCLAEIFNPNALMRTHSNLRRSYQESKADPRQLLFQSIAAVDPDVIAVSEQSDTNALHLAKVLGYALVQSPPRTGKDGNPLPAPIVRANLFLRPGVIPGTPEEIAQATQLWEDFFCRERSRLSAKLADLTEGANYVVPLVHEGAKFYAIPAHFKSNGSQTAFLLDLARRFNQQLPDGNVVVLGDINNTVKTTPQVFELMRNLTTRGEVHWTNYGGTTNKCRRMTLQRPKKLNLADDANKDVVAVFGPDATITEGCRVVAGARVPNGAPLLPMPSADNPFDHAGIFARVVVAKK